MIENAFIPLADGSRLAVQLWLPAGPPPEGAPAVLEYVPYRKRDRYRRYGLYWGRTLAQHGVGYARIDLRGTGDSTGLLTDEYLAVEQQDAVAAIEWLANQPWCNGKVGMRGVSWGGFSTLQTAALAPSALAAIMPMCASDRRYDCDAHYIGGAVALTGLKWATSFKLVMAGPPDPILSGPSWRSEWEKRLAATPPIAARWLWHQTNDAYWRHGSIGLDWAAIRCPTYVVGGLVDPYTDAIPRLLTHLQVPRKGLIGPWRHGYPSPASPGPALDWAFEEVRWWRHWLAGEETGIMDEPMLRVFMPEATAAEVAPGPIPGRWIAEPTWPPSPAMEARRFHFGAGGLHAEAQPAETVTCGGGAIVGLGKIEWVPFAPTELPREQSADDALSVVFDTPPLADDLEVLGSPALRVRVAADRPIADLAVRLCQVDPEGRSWLVSWGLLNLTHRQGDDRAEPLEPGQPVVIELALTITAHRFRRGHRIRAAFSESLWPLVWPSPHTATLTLSLAETSLHLPVRTPPEVESPMPIPLAAPAPSSANVGPSLEIIETSSGARVVEAWPVATETLADLGETVTGSGPNLILSMTAGEPSSCVWNSRQTARYRREGWDIELTSEVTLTASERVFHVEERLVATFNGEPAADVRHVHDIARRLL